MATPAIHPDTIFNALFSKPGRSERRDALTRLQQICRQHYESGSRDFSITNIGKECETQGIIKSRALYNAQSADYRALIEAWAVFAASERDGAKGDSEAPKNRNNYVSRILDPAIRARVDDLIWERDSLRVQLSLAEAEKQLSSVKVRNEMLAVVTPAKKPRGRPMKNVSEWILKPGDLEALKKAISPTFMISQGWRPGSKGEVVNSQGQTVYEPEYSQAIKKILANKKEPE